jgi:hypothetical protein
MNISFIIWTHNLRQTQHITMFSLIIYKELVEYAMAGN